MKQSDFLDVCKESCASLQRVPVILSPSHLVLVLGLALPSLRGCDTIRDLLVWVSFRFGGIGMLQRSHADIDSLPGLLYRAQQAMMLLWTLGHGLLSRIIFFDSFKQRASTGC